MCILKMGKRPEVFPNYWEMATIFQNKISKLLKLYNSAANIPQIKYPIKLILLEYRVIYLLFPWC